MKEIVVALSGTLETFSLPDVLRLLSSTKKTGLLALDGDRGRGRIWVRDGAIVAADADGAVNGEIDGVAFELLRFADADFEFESGAEAPTEGAAHHVDDVLAEAESRLSEWREIEAVVPSLDVWVHMVAELGTDRTVTPLQWRVLAQVGTGATGHALAGRLGQGEYDVCRQLRDLVQDGMIELDEAPAASAPVLRVDVDAAWDAASEPTFVEPTLDAEDVTSLGADLASFVADGTVPDAVPVDVSEPVPEPEAEPVVEADDEDDFLSQLSQLSPKAAAAVEATWGEDAPVDGADELDQADHVGEADHVDAETAPAPAGDDIDQNLLLRFLSSAKG